MFFISLEKAHLAALRQVAEGTHLAQAVQNGVADAGCLLQFLDGQILLPLDGRFFQCVGGGTAQTLQRRERQTDFAVLHDVAGTAALAQFDGQELIAAHQHLVDELQRNEDVFVLGVFLFLQAALDLVHVGAGHCGTAHSGFVVDVVAAHCEVDRIKRLGTIDLEPHQPDGRHQIGHRMGFREHILDLPAGLDVPVRDFVFPHGFFPAGLEAALGHLALTDSLHDIEGHLRFQPLAEQVEHDAVTAADDLGDGAGAAADQLIGVVGPDVRAMGQAGDLDQLGEVFGPGLHQHSAHEVRAHFRDAEGAGLAVDLLRRHAQRFRAGQQAVHLGVVHGDGVDWDAGVLLKILVEGGHIVTQFVQLEKSIVEVFELEVGGQQAARHVIGRVLDGAEVVDLVGVGHDDHAAGVLAGGALDAGAAQRQAVLLGVIDRSPPLFQIFFDVAIRRFVLDAGHGAGLEDVGLAEQLFGVAVDVGLVLAGEVQVDIRLLVAVKAQEGLERDVVAVHEHPGAAVGAVFIRQVEAVVHAAVGDELAVSALGAAVVGRQTVDLRDAGEVRHSR